MLDVAALVCEGKHSNHVLHLQAADCVLQESTEHNHQHH
jgi:hypothetical protein